MSEAKDADVDRLTKEQIEQWRTTLCDPDDFHAHAISELNALCDLALQSLSQEAVRDEALEEAANRAVHVLAEIMDSHFGPHRHFECAKCEKMAVSVIDGLNSALLAALKREPNAAAKIGQSYEVMGIEQTSAPAAPDVARFHGPQDPGFWAAVSDQRFSNEYIGIALRGWLDAQSPKDARSLR